MANRVLEKLSKIHSVMVVDQEKLANLIVRMLGDTYQTEVVTHGLWAFRKMRKGLPDVVVVDVRVPGNGIRLAELIGMSPELKDVPVILTGANPQPDIVLRARNAGASSFLAKPFGPRDLQRRIDLVVAATQKLQNQEGDDENEDQSIMQRVKSIEELPSFPATHAEILKLAKGKKASSQDIAEKIQLDPGLLATVFKLVNSSYYGFGRKIDSLNLAVTLLGLEEVANLVMAAQVFDKLGHYDGGAGIDLHEFWKHSVGTAFIAREIAKHLKVESDSAFLSGMLHDLGKIVLDRYFSEYYAEVVRTVQQDGVSIYEAEKAVLSVSHAEIGGQLAREWKLADPFYASMVHHHCPQNAQTNTSLVCLIHLADVLCKQMGYGSGGDDILPEFDALALETFSLDETRIGELAEVADCQLENADSFLAALGG